MVEGLLEIMTLGETSKYLKIGVSTHYKMLREVKIPAVKIEPRRNNEVIIRLPYNQEFRGHNISKTTEIYTHVGKVSFAKIKNPLDNIMWENMISNGEIDIRNDSHIFLFVYMQHFPYERIRQHAL